MSLKIKDVWKSYRQGDSQVEVLRGLSLTVEKAESVAILGQSGSGKSTFLSLLAGLDVPDRGEIEIEGQRIDSLSIEERTRFRGEKIGIVFQQFHLIPHLTALENVMLPLEIQGESKAEPRALELLQSVGLSHRTHHFPAQMSGGECQRVAIARALIVQPAILLADEPSGSLDQDTGENVMNLLFDLVQKLQMSMILVTHNPEVANRCSKRYVLRGGVCEPV